MSLEDQLKNDSFNKILILLPTEKIFKVKGVLTDVGVITPIVG
jgi:hypothetical protein